VLDKIVNDISNIGIKLGSNSDFFYISNNNDVPVISLLKSENDPLWNINILGLIAFLQSEPFIYRKTEP
jgi:hypothetical protein